KKYVFSILALGIAFVSLSPSYSFNSGLQDVDAAQEVEETTFVNDPLEDLNRSIFDFNQDFDKYILNPLAEVYDEGLPDEIKDRIHSVLSHLNIPLIFV